jgi:glycosyltransferase involved in cell wall biosynthesis
MRVCVYLDHRFTRTPDGACWTSTVHPYSFWKRYLSVFEDVSVVARVEDVTPGKELGTRADGERVSFVALAHFVGPWQYLRRAATVRTAARTALGSSNAIILRVSCHTSSLVDGYLRKHRRPFGVEAINDPWDMFGPGTQDTWLRPYLRWSFSRRMRLQCRDACAAAYVTRQALQRRYPPSSDAFVTSYADGELPASAFRIREWTADPANELPRVVTVAPLGHLNKGTDVLIAALSLSKANGFDFVLDVVGDGRCRTMLQRQTIEAGVQDRVSFAGNVPGPEAVQEFLDRADLFVLPSRHEGLPRAMIEAMARGLPCIGSDAGGIPELLAAEEIVPRNDAVALAGKIREILSDRTRSSALSVQNYQKALQHRDDALQGRRIEFFRSVRASTQEWINSDARSAAGRTATSFEPDNSITNHS